MRTKILAGGAIALCALALHHWCVDLLRLLEVVTGVLINLIAFYDLFKSVVLPRPAINKFVLIRSAFFALWNFWLWANERQAPARREGWLATFAPIASASVITVASVNAGLRTNRREAKTVSLQTLSNQVAITASSARSR